MKTHHILSIGLILVICTVAFVQAESHSELVVEDFFVKTYQFDLSSYQDRIGEFNYSINNPPPGNIHRMG